MLHRSGIAAPPHWMWKPRSACVIEADRGTVLSPGERDTAAVPAETFRGRASERGILSRRLGQPGVVGKPQFLTLIEVDPTGKSEHEHCRSAGEHLATAGIRLNIVRTDSISSSRAIRPSAVGITEPGRVADHIVVGEHPCGRRIDGIEAAQRSLDHGTERFRLPLGAEECEVEGLLHLVRPDPFRKPFDRRYRCFCAEHSFAVVLPK